MNVVARVDTSNLMAATKILQRHSTSSPARNINKAAIYVIRRAQALTPVATPGEINSDMQVTTSPAITSRGNVSTNKRRQNEIMDFTSNDDEVNAAMMIVIARTKLPGDSKTTGRPNFNLITGNRWALAMPAFKTPKQFGRMYGDENGKAMARQAFWAWVEQKAEQMVRARRSSSAFMKHSWTAIIQKLIPYASKRGGMGDFTSVGDFSDNKAVLLSGEVKPAMEGRAVAYCECANTIGMRNGNSVLGEKYNAAAHQILEKPLQDAINDEFKERVEYAEKQEWAADEPELRALGLLVKP